MSSQQTTLRRTLLTASPIRPLQDVVSLSTSKQRPRYFDGRFLAASDLTQEQDYFLRRQLDFGRSAGAGVAWGLLVTNADERRLPYHAADWQKRTLLISAGLGVTQEGAIVSVPEPLTVDLSTVRSKMAQWIEQLGLPTDANTAPSGSFSGVYIVALRPVEYTATPTAVYPTSLTGTRERQDSDIIEATAVTLLPYPTPAGMTTDECRAYVAHQIFCQRTAAPIPAAVLPLAVIGVEQNQILWVDRFLVRRERVADQCDRLPFGSAIPSLAEREAFLKQYDEHLLDVELPRGWNDPNRQVYSASTHFHCLPPAGRLPTRMVDLAHFTQSFFPAAMQVAITVAPEDEAALLVKESLSLPVLDLTAPAEELAQVSVLIVIPASRNAFLSWARQHAPDGRMPIQQLTATGSRPMGGATWMTRVASLSRIAPPLPTVVGQTAQRVWASIPAASADIEQFRGYFYIRRRWVAAEGGVLSAGAVEIKKP